MITKMMEVNISTGLDPQTIAMFIQIASRFESSIYVETGNARVNAKSIMGMMTLGMPKGEKITVIASGADEEEAIKSIKEYLNA